MVGKTGEPFVPREPFVTVYKSIGGWKAQIMVWDEKEQMYASWQTGFFGYEDKSRAIKDAKAWAKDEEIAYVEKNDRKA